MILCIDSGNTRLKWGMAGSDGWLSRGALPRTEINRLGESLAGLPPPERILAANVAGPEVAAALEAALAPWRDRLTFVRSESRRAGVVNGYAEPERLGVDRWCALIGARRMTRSACLVVGAGTATTIDTLDETGQFRGGFILPGFDLMRGALARNTAALPLAHGRYEEFPRCTDDAIVSGCLEAQIGAVERAFARLADCPGAQCLVFGGGAPCLAGYLSMPCRQVENLVLDGLLELAAEQYN